MNNMKQNKFSLGNKLLVVGAAVLLVSICASAAIKFGTDSTGQSWNGNTGDLITCSNGKAFAVTGAGLQAAIYSLNSTGGVVMLPVGNISVTSTIYVREHNITIRGVGGGDWGTKGASIISVNTNNDIFNISGTSDSTRITNFIIEDVKFRNFSYHSGIPLHIRYATVPVIRRCSFSWLRNTVIHIQSAYGFQIESCYTQACGNTSKPDILVEYIGALISNHGEIGNCIFEAPKYGSIYLNARGCEIFNNFFEEFAGAPTGYGISLSENANSCHIYANEFLDNTLTAAALNWIVLTSTQLTKITDNTISGGQHGVYISGAPCFSNIVTGNTIRNCIQYGVYVAAGHYNLVSNNIISNCGSNTNFKGGIFSGSFTVISGNQIIDCSKCGIYLNNANNVTIENNGIYEDYNSGTLLIAVDGGGTSDYNIFRNNYLDDLGLDFDAWIPNIGTHRIVYGNINSSFVLDNKYFVFPVVNCTTAKIPTGYSYYDITTHKLYVYEGAGVWKSSTFT